MIEALEEMHIGWHEVSAWLKSFKRFQKMQIGRHKAHFLPLCGVGKAFSINIPRQDAKEESKSSLHVKISSKMYFQA